MTRRTPTPDAPATIWHEAHPGRPDLPLRICHHHVVKVSAKFVYVAGTCDQSLGHGSPVCLAHEWLEGGGGAWGVVGDRDPSGRRFRAAACFFAGPVPAKPLRGSEWYRARDRWQRVQEGKTWEKPAGSVSGYHSDLAALGLTEMPDAAALKRAWQTTAKRTHPDAGGTAAQFTRAKAAYERLARAVEREGVATGF